MTSVVGWLLDLYADEREGVVLWWIAKDGQRLRLHQSFEVKFSASGSPDRLRAAWRWLKNQPIPVQLGRDQGRDLFIHDPVTLLTIQSSSPTDHHRLFSLFSKEFPDLDYYDADVELSIRHAAKYGTFPLACCSVDYNPDNMEIRNIEPLDSAWSLDPSPPPLRVMTLEPDLDPLHEIPENVVVSIEKKQYLFPLSAKRPLMINLQAVPRRYDPDILLTNWGDTWLLPLLLKISRETHLPLSLNRDTWRGILHKKDKSYFSYGQIVYKGEQLHLFGRCHLDMSNSFLLRDCGLDGVLETARVTTLPLQMTARASPGTGISSMQTLVAIRNSILVPWHKQQAERLKTALDLLHDDQGGMIYQPITGVHTHVGEIDFVSMYPSIMVRCNISPETPAPTFLGSDYPPGLIPLTLKPLLEKRVEMKRALGKMAHWDPRYDRYSAASSAYKALLVTCFGYLGYRNARFGRIESHEAVTKWGRSALLMAKETAEDMGYEVLHMYVDGLWIKKEGVSQPDQFAPLLDEISSRTGLPISLDGVYNWVAFLPSKRDPRIPVPNRYFGCFQDGSIKIRGVEARRRDTAPFIKETQLELLDLLSGCTSPEQIQQLLPNAENLVEKKALQLRKRQVPLDQLVVRQRISRDLSGYKPPPPAARALKQLNSVGKTKKPGQSIKFLFVNSKDGVFAWDLPYKASPEMISVIVYEKLLRRAANSILSPFIKNTLPLFDSPISRK
jgi:DNA polymerase-2